MNETPKKTGLGSSLLLQRTAPAPSHPQPAVAKETPEPSGTSRTSGASETSRPPGRRPPRQPRQRPRIRRTLYLELELDERLSGVAGIERKERSEVINEVLRRHLPQYTVVAQ